jgi:hypothetical protein
MNMKTKTATASIERRIKQFYGFLNSGEVERCYQMIDPRVRAESTSVTLLQYANSLRVFRETTGRLELAEIHVQLHVGEPSRLYEGRDFAVGTTVYEDQHGQRHTFQERWVREGRIWYTRSTGFVCA